MLKFFMLNKVQESDFDSYITVIEIPSIVQVFFFLYVLMDDKLRGPFLLDLTNMVQQNDTNKTRACARGAVDSILKVQRSDAFYFLKALFFFFFSSFPSASPPNTSTPCSGWSKSSAATRFGRPKCAR